VVKRVLQIIPTLERGGAEKQLSLLVTNLPKDEYDLHVCVLTRNGPLDKVLKDAEIPIHYIGKRSRIDFSAFLKLKRLIKKLKPDIVQTWLFAANSYGRMAAHQANVGVIIGNERCCDLWKGSWHSRIDRYLAKRSNSIVVNAPGVRDFYTNRGIAEDLFKVIPNGIETPSQPSQLDRDTLLSELGIPKEAKLIANVNRLWPQKNVKELIWQMNLLRAVLPEVYMLVIGEGPEREKLENFAIQNAIEDQVLFLGERNDVLEILPHCKCLALASNYEGLSNAVMEAMSVGLPVIAQDISGVRDLITHQENGILVERNSRSGFAKHLLKMLESPTWCQTMGENGLKTIQEKFSVQSVTDQYAELYRSLLQC
jgi:glycosyltransferase involved in cell wall biosynthesis